MKDVSASSRHARNAVYPKKRPSPYGISKAHKQSPTYSHLQHGSGRKSAIVLEQEARSQRQAQVLALHRQGVLLEEEYREDIRYYMHQMEHDTMGSMTSMDQQPEIKWHMRPCLVDFLVELHFTFRLRPETLYLALNIIDRYVSRRIVYVKHYQLVGCTALWIAAKFEDAKERVPTVQDLVQVCRDTYEESAFVQMEQHILSTIQWVLGHPTAEAWLRLMCHGPCMEEPRVQHVARFVMEITLFHREFVRFPPSTVALGSLTLARFLCGKGHRIFEETDECLEIVDLLDQRLAKHVNDLSEVLVKKYSYAFYSKAATFVVQFYLKGGRFVRQTYAPLVMPMTPTRSPMSSVASTPASVSTTASDISDDMPVTPTTPLYSCDTLISAVLADSDKENVRSSRDLVFTKHHAEVPEQFLPHDFVTFGRSALSNMNVASPRVAAVS
ncbi:hypothetical protein PUNSTDRAFT_94597 [Punctularia strigosozonata HHB-11173 SS5]|uniref:uncharacterized protein n=1 Tax=Punctularia strigosozonata (strain HHB-11173) TaxID=741275 RepID=UPI000441640E|nr:uncharacterized protein PUNSTDRAFT_94597 [Punctularia strigosozonata HHB-11173 SS5]EIN13508.1 hypothetical protein PUNSTDRAFT_94597 [Punctularia strigosozonata HHB-11173 SS5]